MFAEMRGYTTEELEQLDQKSSEIEERIKKRESQFMEKYGTDISKWSDDIRKKYEYDNE